MNRTTLTALAAIAFAGAATFAVAQQSGHGPGHSGGMMMHGATGGHGAGTAASRGYMEAMQNMQRDIGMPMSGNADRDFVAMMIPHHQSAIDMARVALQHGSYPEVRALAEAIIRDQEREIGQMRGILARLPAR